jgi:hypothetical protein
MMAARPQPSGAWWKQLSDHLHQRTHNRLRRLQIRAVGGRVSIQAIAPCDRVRNQAEEAAREVVPDDLLAMRIKVDGHGEIVVSDADGRSTTPASTPGLFVGQVLHRRLRRLVGGN